MLELVKAARPETDPLLTLDHVTLIRGGAAVLDALSLDITAGVITAIMGANGAGKSLAMRVMAGLIAPEAGQVRYAPDMRAPRDVSIVFQRPVLLRRSVRGNLRHALKVYGVPRNQRTRRLAELLELGRLGLIADTPARALSGGEQQRVAMVRALAAKPKLLLLDEPTASLDPQATQAIEQLMRKAADDGATVVIVTHDRGQAKRLAQDIRFMHRGKLVEKAPAKRFFDHPTSAAASAYLSGELFL